MTFVPCLDEFIHISRFRRRISAPSSGVFGLTLIFWERIRPWDSRRHQWQGGATSALALKDHVVENNVPKVLLGADAI